MRARDLPALGALAERNALRMHADALAADPPLLYWVPATVACLQVVQRLRDAGIGAWATIDAGPHVVAMCAPEQASRVEDALPRLPAPDAIIANPPRTGLHARVSEHLSRWGESAAGRRLCYVSCDPATLARDLKRMTPFRLSAMTAYDLFPQTAHVESVAVMES